MYSQYARSTLSEQSHTSQVGTFLIAHFSVNIVLRVMLQACSIQLQPFCKAKPRSKAASGRNLLVTSTACSASMVYSGMPFLSVRARAVRCGRCNSSQLSASMKAKQRFGFPFSQLCVHNTVHNTHSEPIGQLSTGPKIQHLPNYMQQCGWVAGKGSCRLGLLSPDCSSV